MAVRVGQVSRPPEQYAEYREGEAAMKGWTLLVAGVLVLGFVAAGALYAEETKAKNEEKVTIDQVPAAVKATILKEAGDNKITEIEKETKDGKTIYEAEWIVGDKKIEIKVAEDGTLLSKKTEDADEDKDDDKDEGGDKDDDK